MIKGIDSLIIYIELYYPLIYLNIVYISLRILPILIIILIIYRAYIASKIAKEKRFTYTLLSIYVASLILYCIILPNSRQVSEIFEYFNKSEAWESTEMVYIAPGEFIMGCMQDDQNCQASEMPQRRIYINGYWIDKYEVTQRQFINIKMVNYSKYKKCGKNCPIESVDWLSANGYCNKLGKRLPTEAEWEKAAKGVANSKYNIYDEDIYDSAWFVENAQDKPYDVGERKPNDYGLYDMSGNVMEWVQDCYDANWLNKISDGQVNPVNECKDVIWYEQIKVAKGGSWESKKNELRPSSRIGIIATEGLPTIGFRCAKD